GDRRRERVAGGREQVEAVAARKGHRHARNRRLAGLLDAVVVGVQVDKTRDVGRCDLAEVIVRDVAVGDRHGDGVRPDGVGQRRDVAARLHAVKVVGRLLGLDNVVRTRLEAVVWDVGVNDCYRGVGAAAGDRVEVETGAGRAHGAAGALGEADRAIPGEGT